MNTLYQIISAAFCVIVVLSNILSAKLVPLPFFHNISVPVGVFIYPLTFLLSDWVIEIYGVKKAKLMVYIAFGMCFLSFGIIQVTLLLPASTAENQSAFQATFGLSGLRLFSSITAYLMAQIVAIRLYALIKKWTNERYLWLRNNGSTLISQLVDTVAIDMIYLYWGLNMKMSQVLPIMIFAYAFKSIFSAGTTPFLYFFLFLTRRSSFMRADRTLLQKH